MITTRATIAAALSAIDGVTGYPEKPSVVTVGDAWPLVDSLTRGPGQAFQTTWRIAVVLGPDVGTATDQFDTLIPEAVQALREVVYVDSARPLQIPTEGANLFGVEITARSE